MQKAKEMLAEGYSKRAIAKFIEVHEATQEMVRNCK